MSKLVFKILILGWVGWVGWWMGGGLRCGWLGS